MRKKISLHKILKFRVDMWIHINVDIIIQRATEKELKENR